MRGTSLRYVKTNCPRYRNNDTNMKTPRWLSKPSPGHATLHVFVLGLILAYLADLMDEFLQAIRAAMLADCSRPVCRTQRGEFAVTVVSSRIGKTAPAPRGVPAS
ncbi:hypothetical protein AOLI_G00079950 [Acnodon oligacanthus]